MAVKDGRRVIDSRRTVDRCDDELRRTGSAAPLPLPTATPVVSGGDTGDVATVWSARTGPVGLAKRRAMSVRLAALRIASAHRPG